MWKHHMCLSYRLHPGLDLINHLEWLSIQRLNSGIEIMCFLNVLFIFTFLTGLFINTIYEVREQIRRLRSQTAQIKAV